MKLKKIKPVVIPEHIIQKNILEWLKWHTICAWRNNVGRKGYLKFGIKGQCDITGILKDGRRLEIEVKDIKGKVSKEQTDFINMINFNGGVAFVARDVFDVERVLKL